MADSGSGEKGSRGRLPYTDSLHEKAGRVASRSHGPAEENWIRTLSLGFQAIGVIYGDLGTSPLYTYSSTFPKGIKHPDDILGVLSLIIYTIILLPLLKYVFIVLYANDNGDGGAFAMYSLISRYAKVSLIPNQQAEDAMVSNYQLELPSSKLRVAQWIKRRLETSTAAKVTLFCFAILGTSMVIGDGILTPAISVLSAVGGLAQKATLNQREIDWISAGILIALFAYQRFGTDKVGYTFAPVLSIWFLFIASIGLYNLIAHDVGVLRAFNPAYIVTYFKRNGYDAWTSLGGVVLCITGTEAMFADLGHFSIRAVQVSFSFVIFPAVILCYIGQGAFLRKFPDKVADTFYAAIPGPLFWPQFILAVLAAIIASQAMISGAFAIISQSQTLGCFPRVKVMHTSKKYEGQVYIPEINFILGLGTVIVTLAFKTTDKIGNAYGIAVLFVMNITTAFLIIIMLMIWKLHIALVAAFLVVFGIPQLMYLAAVLYKFPQGGYLPFGFGLVLVIIMAIWHYVHVKKYWYELDHVVSSKELVEVTEKHEVRRIPGVGFMYTDLVQGVPPIFAHLVQKIPFVHSVFVFVTIKHMPIPYILLEERFIFKRVEPRKYGIFRCVARFGYNDGSQMNANDFSASLLLQLKQYILTESVPALAEVQPGSNGHMLPLRSGDAVVYIEEALEQPTYEGDQESAADSFDAAVISNSKDAPTPEEEVQMIEIEMNNGIVYLLGETEVVASRSSNIFKKIVVNMLYSFLRKNFRQGEKAFGIPRDQLLKVGTTYEI